MTSMSTAAAPIVIFGDLEADLWGVVLGGEAPAVAVAGLSDADVDLRPAELDREDDDVWTLTASGCALRIERADAATASTEEDRELTPCRVSGSATIDGSEREFDVGGVRSTGALATAGIESLRLLGTWFPAGHEIALLSSRPRGAKGHDRDSIGVVARGEEHPLVLDPRLSTTYDAHGEPRRVGVELWLGDDEDGDQWPRRVAAAATGSHVDATAFSAHALRCVSRGEAGAGVYALLTPAKC
jgi:hypothetical protein